MSYILKKAATSTIIEFMMRDATTGQGKTGLATGDMSGAYVVEGGTHLSLSFSAGSAGDAYSSTKFAEVDSTNMPGVYQYHIPNSVLNTTADAITIRFGGTGCLDKIIRLNMLDIDVYDATSAGISRLDATVSSRATDDAAEIYTYFTDGSREDAFKANVSGLSTFDHATDSVTVSTNNDKTGYSISGTVTTLDGLNDIAATDIVSNGAITTASGAVSSVTTVATCTTNTDMRGTDSALLASSVPTNFSSLAITAAGKITVGTNDDKTGYEINGSLTMLDDLDLITAAEVNTQVDTALSDIGLDHLLSASVTGTDVTDNSVIARLVSKEATADWDDFDNTTDSLQAIRDRGDSSWGPGSVPSASQIADAVLDEALADHTTAGSLGKAVADIESETDGNATKLTTIDGKLDTVDSIVDAILVDTGTTLPATLTTIDNEIAVIDGNVDAILIDTGTTLPATLAGLSTLDAAGVRSAVGLSSANLDTQLQTIDSNVDAILIDTSTTIPTQISGLNDLDAAGVRSAVGLASNNLDTQLQTIDANVDAILVDTSTSIPDQINLLPDSGSIADAVWDESLSQHNSAGSTGKALKQLKDSTITAESQVNDGSATSTTFVTDLTETTDGFYHDKVIVFISGDLSGQARHIETYTGSTKSITVSQAFTAAPADDDEFIILAGHEHSLAEIADSVWDEAKSGHTVVGSFGYYLDARVSQVSGGGGASASDIWGALLSDYATPGTFGARFQTGTRFTNTTANIQYVTQGNSYDDVANNRLTWEVTKDYTGYSVEIEVTHRVTGSVLLTKTVTVIDATTLKLALTTTDTAFSTLTTDADFGAHPYSITATSGDSVDTAVSGAMVIRKA